MLRKAIYCLAILQMAAAAVTEICDESKEILCREQNNCDQCIQAHSCCSYCYDQSFKGSRCDFRENLLQNGCPEGLLEKTGGSTRSKVASGGNEDFSDYTVKNGATQLKPQHFKLYLRKGESQRIQFSYRPTRNYPLDLYYLMDVSYTMSDDIDTITSLGNQLAENLRKLTNNFRLALGLYSEKNAMPFSYTLKEELVEHCYENRAECVEGFDFKHRLNFTSKISDFIQKVGALKQETTMNIDEPEAGLDALMQIMSCERYMNWLPDSRKIVVMATDGTLHWAGDGILMGGVKRNFSRCWLDENGVYTKALENDYPSLEEVYRKLQHTKTNAVFAAKSNVFDYYKSINALMPDLTFTAKLEERSRNVIELVKSGYSSFIKHIKFSTNTTEAPELKIIFRTNCSELNYLNETQTCENIAEGMVYVFDVEIALRDDFMGQRTGTTIYIEEQDINERVQIDIEYIGTKCECVNEIKPSVAQNCKNGDYRCGKCNCFEGSTGQFCNLTCHDSVDYCRQNIGDSVSLICNRRGDCDCGYCKCDFGYTGKYCQHSCPIAHRKVCDDHGVCIEGKCDCHPGYTGETCSCSLSKNTCRIPEAIEDCSGRGVCKCGKCDCTEDFYGDYCEKCSGCSGFCSIYAERVVEHFTKEQKESQEETGKRELVFINGDTEAIEELCTVRYPKDETFCETNYKYHINPSVVTIYITANECRKPIAATMKVGVAVGILLAIGIFAICCYKCYIVRQDKIEYARFEEKQKREMKSENPIYVSPISSYEVPLEMRNLREKDD